MRIFGNGWGVGTVIWEVIMLVVLVLIVVGIVLMIRGLTHHDHGHYPPGYGPFPPDPNQGPAAPGPNESKAPCRCSRSVTPAVRSIGTSFYSASTTSSEADEPPMDGERTRTHRGTRSTGVGWPHDNEPAFQ